MSTDKRQLMEAKEKTENSFLLMEKMKTRGDVAMIFLKGGMCGGMDRKFRKKLLNVLGQWFEVVEGDKHSPSFGEICTRWGAGLEYQFRKMENNEKFSKENIDEGRKYIQKKNKIGFDIWMNDMEIIDEYDAGLIRQKFVLNYFSKQGQVLLLKLKKGVSREKIMQDLGFDNREVLLQAVGKKRVDKNWLDEKETDMAEFVKRIVVGETTALKAAKGTLRNLAAKELIKGGMSNVLKDARDLMQKGQGVWEVKNGDYNKEGDSMEQVLSTLTNAVHTVEFSIEEFEIMSDRETKKFMMALND